MALYFRPRTVSIVYMYLIYLCLIVILFNENKSYLLFLYGVEFMSTRTLSLSTYMKIILKFVINILVALD